MTSDTHTQGLELSMSIYNTDDHERLHYLEGEFDKNCFDCRDEERMDAITRREDAFEYEGIILKGFGG